MVIKVTGAIRRLMGWCPNADAVRPTRRTSSEAGYGGTW